MEEIKEQEKPSNPKQTMIRLWSYLRKDRAKIILVTLLTILGTIASVLGPLLLGIALDQFIAKSNSNGFLFILLALALLFILRSIFTWLTNFVVVRISEDSLYRLRQDLFNHLEKLPLSFFDKHQKGDLMSRFTNDVSLISDTLTDSVTQVISSIIMLIGVTIIMFVMNPILAIVTIITVPVFFFIVMKIGVKANHYFTVQQKQVGNLNSFSEEMISGMKVVKSYVKEEQVINHFTELNNTLRNTSIQAEIYSNLIMPANTFITNIGNIVLITVGGIMTVHGACTVGSILAFLNYAGMFRNPINSLASLYASIQAALAGAERVFQILDEPVETDLKKGHSFDHIEGNVLLQNVDFSYIKGHPVLKNICMEVAAGENIALVGPTGAGKTTIINLLTRFYEIDRGIIMIDGIDIQEVKKSDLRKKIGIVLQDTYLFKGTVKDNIRYSNPKASDEDIIEASKKAQAHSFIHRLPQGYDTFVEEEGSNFSQGQRQLISIARAILADPEILILDEATSSVDTRTEKLITKGMQALMENRTCFIIAHRLSTIRDADEIMVIRDGEIIERGKHEELLKKGGFYHQLYKSQFEE